MVNLTESIPMAYVKVKNTYGVIDKNGKALEKLSDKLSYNIPELTEITVSKFTPSEKISVKEEEKFKKTLEILRDLYNNNFIDKVESVSVSDDMIKLSISDKLTVELGSFDQLNAKIVMVKEIVATLDENDFGIIDASNADRVYYDRVMPDGSIPEEEQTSNTENPSLNPPSLPPLPDEKELYE